MDNNMQEKRPQSRNLDYLVGLLKSYLPPGSKEEERGAVSRSLGEEMERKMSVANNQNAKASTPGKRRKSRSNEATE